jgi:hypothetical protein
VALGTILFSFSLFGKIVGVCMVVNAAFNAYILLRYPGYEDIQRNDAQSDIKDFLASNPAFAKKMVSASVDIIKSNPGMCVAMCRPVCRGLVIAQKESQTLGHNLIVNFISNSALFFL